MLKSKNQKGEIVIEATIVVTIVVVFMAVLFYIGMLLYQQAILTTAANNAAATIAQTYSNELRDPFTGYIDADNIYQTVTYSSMKNDATLQVMEEKANAMTLYRIKTSTILTPKPTVEVEVVDKENELLKSQIVVTVTDTYTVPLVGFFGVDNKIKFTATGRADCVDILEYIYGVEAIGNPEGSPIQSVDEQNWVVIFIPDRDTGKVSKTVPVLANHSIISSNSYTHSVMPSNPVKGDLQFSGWVDENGNAFNANTTVTRNMTVYGQWLCAVTFDPCGSQAYGASVTPTSMKVVLHKTANFPTPKRNGNYTFLGWFTQKDGKGTQYISGVTPIEGNVTLYAFWRCDHDYQLTERIVGTCITQAKETYKCKQCGKVDVRNGSYGDHQFEHTQSIAGTCVTKGKNVYTCKLCGKQNVYEGNYGDHSFRCIGYTGTYCYEIQETYQCDYCGTQKSNGPIHNRNVGQHNFSRRCDPAHSTKKFYCTTTADAQGNIYPCGAKSYYHSTCAYCGKIQPKYSMKYGNMYVSNVVLCGVHSSGRLTTGCGCNGTMF